MSRGINGKTRGQIKPTKGKVSGLSGLSLRTWIICILVILFLASINLKGYLTQSYSTLNVQNVPAVAPYAVLLLCLLYNLIINRIIKKKRLQIQQEEMIAIYIGVAIGGLVLSDALVSLVTTMIAGVPQVMMAWGREEIISQFIQNASNLVLLKDENAMWMYWFGGADVPWGRWAGPILLWTLLYTAIFFVFLCMVSIVRKQWIEREHLRFPLNIPVFAIVQGDNSQWSTQPLWKDKVFYIGLIWPVFSGITSILSLFIPAIPTFSGINIQLWTFFNEEPLVSALGWHYPLHFLVTNPAWVGVAYFIPLDVAFSLVFFQGMLYMQRILVAIGGWNNNLVPAREVQGAAGLFTLAIWLLWLVRADIKNMVLTAIGRRPMNINDSNEPMSYRATVLGLIFGGIFIMAFFNLFLGTPIFTSILYMGILFLALLGYCRLRAEAGFPSWIAVQGYGIWVWNATFGPLINPSRDMGVGMLFNLEYSGFGTYTGLLAEAFHLGDKGNLNRRKLVVFVLVIFAIATMLGFIFSLNVVYENGMNQLRYFTRHQAINEAWRASFAWPEQSVQGPRPQIFIGASMLTLFLSIMRARFVWWPFHPIGYIASGNDIMGTLWGSVFVVWIIKLFLYRYAGSKTVKRLAPAFIGMIVGFAGMSVVSWLVSNIRLFFL